jgi:hypothetical protein
VADDVQPLLSAADVDGLEALGAVRRGQLLDYWQRRTDGEWTTMEAFDHVRDDLLALGAPSALLQLADRVIADERRHTQWCHGMVEQIGGQSYRAPRLRGTERLAFPGMGAKENRWLRPIFSSCFSETIAVCVLRQSRQDLRPGPIRRAQRQQLADEVGHARLGWGFLAYAAESGQLRAPERRAIGEALPMMAWLARKTWGVRDEPDDPELAALGYFTRAQLESGLQTAFDEVLTPGLERYGFSVG